MYGGEDAIDQQCGGQGITRNVVQRSATGTNTDHFLHHLVQCNSSLQFSLTTQ